MSWENSGFTVGSARGENITRRELGSANRVDATTRGDTTAEGARHTGQQKYSKEGWGGAGRGRGGAIDGSALRWSGVCVANAGAMAGAGSSAELSSGAR